MHVSTFLSLQTVPRSLRLLLIRHKSLTYMYSCCVYLYTTNVPKLSFTIFFPMETIGIKNNNMASWTAHLALFFDIVATDIEAFVVSCNQFEKNTLVILGAQRCKELSHSLLHLSIILEVRSRVWLSVQGKDENPMEQDRGCRAYDPISPFRSDESYFVWGFALPSKSQTPSLRPIAPILL